MRYAPGRLDTLGAIATEVLLVAGLLDTSCIYRWGHDGGVRSRERGGCAIAPQVRLLHRRVGPGHTRTAPPRRRVRGRLQRSGGHEGGYRGGRQGRLLEGDRGERGFLGPSRRRRPTEERLERLECLRDQRRRQRPNSPRPQLLSPCQGVSGRNDVIYPPEFEEGEFCEVGLHQPLVG